MDNNPEDVVLMNIGLRRDEEQRVKRLEGCRGEKIKASFACETKTKRHKWRDFYWRVLDFPLYHDRIIRKDVVDFFSNKNYPFSEVSNCDFCFFHTNTELNKQFTDFPDRGKSWINLEKESGQSFGDKFMIDLLKEEQEKPVQLELNFCFCTD